jgi:glycosyltransferase involved in cell wall biosynthesis
LLTSAASKTFGAKVIYYAIRNISSVRNRGANEAKYNLIVPIDADCTAPSDAFPKILKFMGDGRYIGGGLGLKLVSGKTIARLIVPIVQFCVEELAVFKALSFSF